MDKLNSHGIFSEYTDSIKNISYDTGAKQSLSNSTYNIINFDKVVEGYCKINQIGQAPMSVDGLCLSETDDSFFVEFKNGDFKIHEIQLKATESLLIYSDLAHQHISDIKKRFLFILVYNSKKFSPSKREMKDYLSAKGMSRKEKSFDKLHKFKMLYFKEVQIYNQEEFDDFLSRSYI